MPALAFLIFENLNGVVETIKHKKNLPVLPGDFFKIPFWYLSLA